MKNRTNGVLVAGASTLLLGAITSVAGAQMMAPGGGAAQQGGGLQDLRHPQSQISSAAGTVGIMPEDLGRMPLTVGDVLEIQVYETNITGIYALDSEGNLALPLIGKMHVDGLTISETQAKIADALKAGRFVLQPSVTVTLQSYVPTYVTVVGEVQTPGRFPLLAPHPVQDVLAMAGGPTLAAADKIEIKRNDHGAEQTLELAIQHNSGAAVVDAASAGKDEILPGDQVTVKRAGLIYVLGGVYRPGGYVMQEGGQLNLVQAIALASGTIMQASTKTVKVLRKNPDGSMVESDAEYKRMVNGKMFPMVLQAGDIVYVPISKAKAALMGGAPSVLGSTAAASIIYAH